MNGVLHLLLLGALHGPGVAVDTATLAPVVEHRHLARDELRFVSQETSESDDDRVASGHCCAWGADHRLAAIPPKVPGVSRLLRGDAVAAHAARGPPSA